MFVDTRKVTKAPSTSELRLIAREVKHLTDAGFGPIAVLTGSTWMYGVARMFSVFVQALTELVVLGSVEDAQAWIDDYVMLRDARPALPGGNEHSPRPRPNASSTFSQHELR